MKLLINKSFTFIIVILISLLYSCAVKLSSTASKGLQGIFEGAITADKPGGDRTYEFKFDASKVKYVAESANKSTSLPVIYYYDWDFDGDGNTDLTTSAPFASHRFNKVGTYKPKVTLVTTPEHQTATVTKNSSNKASLSGTNKKPINQQTFTVESDTPIYVTRVISAITVNQDLINNIITVNSLSSYDVEIKLTDELGEPAAKGAVELTPVQGGKAFTLNDNGEWVQASVALADDAGIIHMKVFGKQNIRDDPNDSTSAIDLANNIKIEAVSETPEKSISYNRVKPDSIKNIRVLELSKPTITADDNDFGTIKLIGEDKYGNPVLDEPVHISLTTSLPALSWSVNDAGNGKATDLQTGTGDAAKDAGIVQFTVNVNGAANKKICTATLKVSQGSTEKLITLTMAAGAAASINPVCDASNLNCQITAPIASSNTAGGLKVQLLDAYGNPVSDTNIYWDMPVGTAYTINQPNEYGPALAAKADPSDTVEIIQTEFTNKTDANGYAALNTFIAGTKTGVNVYQVRAKMTPAASPPAGQYHLFNNNITVIPGDPANIAWDTATMDALDKDSGIAGVQWYKNIVDTGLNLNINIIDKYGNIVDDARGSAKTIRLSVVTSSSYIGGPLVEPVALGQLLINGAAAPLSTAGVLSNNGVSSFAEPQFNAPPTSIFPALVKLYAWTTDIGGTAKEIMQEVTVLSGVSYQIMKITMDAGTDEEKFNCMSLNSRCDASYGNIAANKVAIIKIQNTGTIDATAPLTAGVLTGSARYSLLATGPELNCANHALLQNESCVYKVELGYDFGIGAVRGINDDVQLYITDDDHLADANVNLSGHRKTPALLSLNPATYDFGTQDYNAEPETPAPLVEVKNLGEVAMTIKAPLWLPSLSSFIVSQNDCNLKTLNYDEACSIKIQFRKDPADVEISTPLSTDLDIGVTTENLAVVADKTVTITGQRRSDAALAFVAPASHNFGDVDYAASACHTFTLKNNGQTTAGLDFAITNGLNNTDFSIGTNDCLSYPTLISGATCNIEVCLSANPVAGGSYTGTLTSAGTRGGTVTATVSANRLPQTAIQISGNGSYPNVDDGDTVTHTFTIGKPAGSSAVSFEIDFAAGSGFAYAYNALSGTDCKDICVDDGFADGKMLCDSSEFPAGFRQCTIDIVLTGDGTGNPASNSISISNASASVITPLPVMSLSGHHNTSVNLSATVVDGFSARGTGLLGSNDIGFVGYLDISTYLTYEIKNAGDSKTTIQDITIVGTDAAQFSRADYAGHTSCLTPDPTLFGGSSCFITAKFDADGTATGTKSGELHFTVSKGNLVNKAFTASRYTQAVISYDGAATVNYGNINNTDTSDLPFTVNKTGTSAIAKFDVTLTKATLPQLSKFDIIAGGTCNGTLTVVSPSVISLLNNTNFNNNNATASCTVIVRLTGDGSGSNDSTSLLGFDNYLDDNAITTAQPTVTLQGHHNTLPDIQAYTDETRSSRDGIIASNFGNINYADTTKYLTYIITNEGDQPTTIQGMSLTGAQASHFTAGDYGSDPSCSNKTLNKGTSCYIKITYNGAATTAGTSNATLGLTLSTSSFAGQAFTANRLTQAVVSISAVSTDFGDVDYGAAKAVSRTFIVAKTADVNSSSLTFDIHFTAGSGFTFDAAASTCDNAGVFNDNFADNVIHASWASGNQAQCSIVIKMTGDGVSNNVSSSISMDTPSASGSIQAPTSITFIGHHLTQASLAIAITAANRGTGGSGNNIGTVDYNDDTASLTYTITNSGESSSAINSVTKGGAQGAHFSLVGAGTTSCLGTPSLSSLGTASCSFKIVYDLAKTTWGASNANLSFSVSADSLANIDPITAYRRKAADMTLSGAVVNFGNVDKGATTAANTFTLTKADVDSSSVGFDINLNVSGAYKVINEAAAGSCSKKCNDTFADGVLHCLKTDFVAGTQTCTIDVTFTGDGTGANESTTMTITNGSASIGTVTYVPNPLTLTGHHRATATLALSGTTDLGGVNYLLTASNTFTVTKAGADSSAVSFDLNFTATANYTYSNSGVSDCSNYCTFCSGAFCSGKVACVFATGAQSCTINIGFNNTMGDDLAHPYNNAISITNVSASGSSTVTNSPMSLTVTAYSQAQVSYSFGNTTDNNMNFGNATQNTNVDMPVTITKTGKSAIQHFRSVLTKTGVSTFDIISGGGSCNGTRGTLVSPSRVYLDGIDNFNVAGVTGTTCTLLVRFTGNGSGILDPGSLLDFTNIADENAGTLEKITDDKHATVSVIGNHSGNAVLTISGDTNYDFGPNPIGRPATKIFVITNYTNGVASSMGAVNPAGAIQFYGGAYPGVGGTCGTVLGGKSMCTIVISFSPTAMGSAGTTTITLSWNDGSSTRTANKYLTGTGIGVKKVSSSYSNTCAIMYDDNLKCWGTNGYGQLGYGDTIARGDTPGTMGDSLPNINLGTGRTVKDVEVSFNYVCAILDNNALKCWGYNNEGELGYGDTIYRGNLTSQMGDNLPAVDLGTSRTAKAIAVAHYTAFQSTTCVILDTNQVKCWGWNIFGQLGYGDTRQRGDGAGEMGNSLPVVSLGTGRSAKAFANTGEMVCVILDNNNLKCWGQNGSGNLGYGDNLNRGDLVSDMGDNLPVVPLGTGRTVKDITVAVQSACAILDNNTIKCWGYNNVGQLGYGDVTDRGASIAQMGDSLPVVQLGTGRTAKKLVAGVNAETVCVILDNNTTKCWGDNSFGTLGYGDTIRRGDNPGEMGDALPVVNFGTARTAQSISGQCALLDNNIVKCWGDKGYGGRLGYGDAIERGDNPGEMGDNLPQVYLGGTKHKTISILNRNFHACAIKDDGAVKCWGDNSVGQLGYGDTIVRGNDPNEVSDNLPNINLGAGRTALAITGGSDMTCALLDNSKVKCWGDNSLGQLGYGDTISRGTALTQMGDTLPYVDVGDGHIVKAVSARGTNACVILDDDNVKCWGDNGSGQLGYGDNIARGSQSSHMGNNLRNVDLGTGRTAKFISSNGSSTFAVLDDNTLKGWGSNTYGQLGYGDTLSRSTPPATATVNLGASRTVKKLINSITISECAILDDNTAKCWGDNTSGQLGTGNTNPITNPGIVSSINVGAGRTVKELSMSATTPGSGSACAILDNNDLKCWGYGGNGNLGYGNTNNVIAVPASISVVPLGMGNIPVSVDAYPISTFVLLSNGKIRSFGNNSSGQLGYGDTIQRSQLTTEAPVDLGDIGIPSKFADYNCAMMQNGKVKCWGWNAYGDLGYGDGLTRGNQPNQMGSYLPYLNPGSGRSISAMSGTNGGIYYHKCAILDNSTLKCWGNNIDGQLGYGDNVYWNSIPAATVNTGASTAKSLAIAQSSTCAILSDNSVKCWGMNYEAGSGYVFPIGVGYGDTLARLSPPTATISLGTTAVSLAAGYENYCALLSTGNVKCWGAQYGASTGEMNGALGYGDTLYRSTPPAATVNLGSTAVQIAGGYDGFCVILTNGSVKCWGSNANGELGQGNTVSSSTPVSVNIGTGLTASKISMSTETVCVMLSTGQVKCWGNNNYGQLGYGDTNNRGDNTNEIGDLLPTVNLGLNRTAKDIAVGNAATCALLDDDTIKCWGAGLSGGIGSGNTNSIGNVPDGSGGPDLPMSKCPILAF